ncbi:xylulose kinase [Pseudoclavibacter chungangensis]|uniref:Xylulose kinase n=1 Tax=Pseudoclavibacter chungangensis TaxID=587635 RepID=A0A7J5C254_9MICO|nr:FGGY family carbohydrate kinase [Pseudoclavibacter chungangensis]KAB1662543.1 xylulose kinase [Pseudoclavibacter chungangensis]NYJ68583.1 xylulokinase [Pseudoclavibacter chungangensis]
MLVAGFDSSTQSCKLVVRDAETGALVRSGRATHPEGTEVPPEAWWRALAAAVADAGGLDDVAAVSIAGQQHGLVALDAEGRVIRDALLWNDTRSAGAARDLIAEFGAAYLAARVGAVPVASFTSTKLRWLRDHEPESAARVAAVALPHDWLTWRLLGYGPADESPLGPDLVALTTDRSDASGTGYWSPRTGDWDRELLVAALGHEVVLPHVLQPNERAGETVEGVLPGVPRGVIVGAGAGDNAGAALGLDAREGDVVVSIGTSGTVFSIAAAPTADATGLVAGFADATGAFLPLSATLNAARVLDATAALLGVDHDAFGALVAEGAAVPHEGERGGGLVLVPYFDGERTPDLPEATGVLAGITRATLTRAGLARASVEGVLCNLAEALDAHRALGVTVRRVLLIGGAAVSPGVQAVVPHVFDVPVDVPAPGEYVADGAARQAVWTLTRVRPDWPVETVAHLDPADDHGLRERYRAEAARIAAR